MAGKKRRVNGRIQRCNGGAERRVDEKWYTKELSPEELLEVRDELLGDVITRRAILCKNAAGFAALGMSVAAISRAMGATPSSIENYIREHKTGDYRVGYGSGARKGRKLS